MKNLSTPATRRDIEDILQVLDTIVQRFDERFNHVEVRLEKVEHRLFALEHRVERLEETATTHGRHIQGIYGYFDSVAKDLEAQERLAMGRQLHHQYEMWILGISKHTGYAFPP